MQLYRLYKSQITHSLDGVFNVNTGASFPIDPANTDYANFKLQINADEAQLEDADGVLMSPEEAKAFVATLP